MKAYGEHIRGEYLKKAYGKHLGEYLMKTYGKHKV